MPGASTTRPAPPEAEEDVTTLRSIRLVIAPLLPGFVCILARTLLAFLINGLVPFISPLTAGVLLGVVAANIGLIRPQFAPGLTLSTNKLLRVGVVLLGLQLSLLEVADLGAHLLLVVVVVVIFGFVFTRWAGHRLGLSPMICRCSPPPAFPSVAPRPSPPCRAPATPTRMTSPWPLLWSPSAAPSHIRLAFPAGRAASGQRGLWRLGRRQRARGGTGGGGRLTSW